MYENHRLLNCRNGLWPGALFGRCQRGSPVLYLPWCSGGPSAGPLWACVLSTVHRRMAGQWNKMPRGQEKLIALQPQTSVSIHEKRLGQSSNSLHQREPRLQPYLLAWIPCESRIGVPTCVCWMPERQLSRKSSKEWFSWSYGFVWISCPGMSKGLRFTIARTDGQGPQLHCWT